MLCLWVCSTAASVCNRRCRLVASVHQQPYGRIIFPAGSHYSIASVLQTCGTMWGETEPSDSSALMMHGKSLQETNLLQHTTQHCSNPEHSVSSTCVCVCVFTSSWFNNSPKNRFLLACKSNSAVVQPESHCPTCGVHWVFPLMCWERSNAAS